MWSTSRSQSWKIPTFRCLPTTQTASSEHRTITVPAVVLPSVPTPIVVAADEEVPVEVTTGSLETRLTLQDRTLIGCLVPLRQQPRVLGFLHGRRVVAMIIDRQS